MCLPLLFLGLAACTASGTIAADSFLASEDTSGVTSDGFPAPSQEAVWGTAMRVVRDQGYVPDPNLSLSEAGRIETRWRLALQPFSGKGHRERVSLRVIQMRKRKNYFRLETNVIRQLNDNISEPSNPIAADWAQGKRNTTMEGLINRRVELTFLPGDVSPEFRAKYGLPTRPDRRVKKKPPEKKDELLPGLPIP